MDIMGSEVQKKIIRLGLRLVANKVKKCQSTQFIKEDMECCADPIYQSLYQILDEAQTYLKCGWQKDILNELGIFGLWVAYKDTAYSPMVKWMLRELKHRIENDPELAQAIENATDPKDWYLNAWIDSKEKTKQMRENGEIPEYLKSPEESIFTPSEQQRRLKKLK